MQPFATFCGVFAVLVAVQFYGGVEAKGFLTERSKPRGLSAAGLQDELSLALGEVMGCGGGVTGEQLATIEQQLRPIWNTLPKNGQGNVERRSLRYLVHRHFGRQSALQIRGFEPSRPASAEGWGDADILAQRVPAFVESFLDSSRKLEQGFPLSDAVRIVATIERLILDSEGGVLEHVFRHRRHSTASSLTREELDAALELYMIHWMMGEDEEGSTILAQNRSLLLSTIPHWDQIVHFARGRVEALEYTRKQAPAVARAAGRARPGHDAFESRFSFEDAHEIVGGITKSFASFWDSECRSMKASLVAMDTRHTGRVPLSKFYSHGLDTEWRFGESEEYLRELGALDETGWLGKQVIIPNYIQATSNCIVSSQHYLVCCVNDCEAILDDIETQIGAPSALPDDLLRVVGNVSYHSSSIDDEDIPNLKGSLTNQLEMIASAHGGEVPLHGRLFAQWLHYAFPRECAFPHKTGTVASLTPAEFGERYIASNEAMKQHAATAANVSDLSLELSRDDLQWMSQWSAEEELIADYSRLGLRAPWEGFSAPFLALATGFFAVLAVAWKLLQLRGGNPTAKQEDDGYWGAGKAHFV